MTTVVRLRCYSRIRRCFMEWFKFQFSLEKRLAKSMLPENHCWPTARRKSDAIDRIPDLQRIYAVWGCVDEKSLRSLDLNKYHFQLENRGWLHTTKNRKSDMLTSLVLGQFGLLDFVNVSILALDLGLENIHIIRIQMILISCCITFTITISSTHS